MKWVHNSVDFLVDGVRFISVATEPERDNSLGLVVFKVCPLLRTYFQGRSSRGLSSHFRNETTCILASFSCSKRRLTVTHE